MTNIEKFYADVQRIKKHDRADNGGIYDGLRAAKAVQSLFENQLPFLKNVTSLLGDYWLRTYIETSDNLSNEPTIEHVDWLAQLLAFFDGTVEKDNVFTKQDWEEIRDSIKYEAEDLPIDFLSSCMSLLLENKAL